jgi:hypothetical protein
MRSFALLLLAACATAKTPPAPPPAAPAGSDPRPAVPPEFEEHLRDAAQIGVALYENDKISAIGTDVLIERVGSLEGKGVGGYLSMQEASDAGTPLDSWLVQFFSRDDDPRIRYRIRIARGKKAEFEALDPPAPASASETALIKARRTALAHLKQVDPPRQPINTVILPGEVLREKGILVYLLAGTKRRGVVMGKHHRVLISSDGTTVLRFEPLTKSILEVDFGNLEPSQKPAAIVVSHIVTEWPLETHVFTSLLHRQPVYVACSQHLWKVDGDRITLLPQPPPHDPDPQHHAALPSPLASEQATRRAPAGSRR